MPSGLVCVIIPSFENYEVLNECLLSITKYTSYEKYRIVVINNGKRNMVTNLRDVDIVNVRENLGWSKGINRGMEHISQKYPECEYVVIMNDDTEVLPHDYDWMLRMQRLMENDKNIAAVGPTSNYVMGLQNLKVKNNIKVYEVNYLVGFCEMIRYSALKEVGGMDIAFEGGDDIDLSIRLRQKGYKLVVARDVFIYHYGAITGKKVHGDKWGDGAEAKLIAKHGDQVIKDTMNLSSATIQEYCGAQNMLSFIVSAYNRPHHLAVVLHSLLAQSDNNWECIVVDEGNNKDVIPNDPRFKHVPFKRVEYKYEVASEIRGTIGLYAKDDGVKHATGEYIVFANDDAYFCPEFVKKMRAASVDGTDLIHCDFVFAHTGYVAAQSVPAMGGITCGNYILRKSKIGDMTFRKFFPDMTKQEMITKAQGEIIGRADGYFIEELVNRGITHKRIPGLFIVYN